jgi:ribosomal protein L37E
MGHVKEEQMNRQESEESQWDKNCKRCGERISDETYNTNGGYCDDCKAEWFKIQKE